MIKTDTKTPSDVRRRVEMVSWRPEYSHGVRLGPLKVELTSPSRISVGPEGMGQGARSVLALLDQFTPKRLLVFCEQLQRSCQQLVRMLTKQLEAPLEILVTQ